MDNPVGRDRPALIAGGGIGGLAAGVALVEFGFWITILEQAEDFKEVAASVQIAPNGARALAAFGVMVRIGLYAWCPTALITRDAFAAHDILKTLLCEDFVRRLDDPYMVIQRAVVLEACKQSPRVQLETNARTVGFDDGLEINLLLADGCLLRGNTLIGADGLGSVVRKSIIGEGPPKPPRYIVYRGVIERARLPAELWSSEVIMWTGPNADFVHYPLRTGELFNLVASFKADRGLGERAMQGSREDLMAPYVGFYSNVQRMLELLNTERRWMVMDREAVSGWACGPVTLIGDAAHPMLQYMAQGACQAMEDVVALVETVCGQPADIPAAFSACATIATAAPPAFSSQQASSWRCVK